MSLAARRILFPVLADPAHPSPRQVIQRARETMELPRPHLSIDARSGELFPTVYHSLDESTVARFAKTAGGLLRREFHLTPGELAGGPSRRLGFTAVDEDSCEPLKDRAPRIRVEGVWFAGEERDYIGQVAAQSACYRLNYNALPLALLVVRQLTEASLGTMGDAELAAHFSLGIEVMHGIPACDVQITALLRENNDRPLSIPDASKIVLNYGSGYYAGDAEAIGTGDLSLPVHEILRPMVEEALRFERRNSLSSLKPVAVFGARKKLIEAIASRAPRMCPTRTRIGLDSAFRVVAIDDLGLPAALVSRLIGRPLPMLRGESAYLEPDAGGLVKALSRVQDRLSELSRPSGRTP